MLSARAASAARNISCHCTPRGRDEKSTPTTEENQSQLADALADENVEDVTELEDVVPYRYSITGYGADYPVDGLVKRLESAGIVIPTFEPEVTVSDASGGFQRQFVWTKAQCDKFVESLLLGLPVPGIFLVKQPDGRFLVLDGQQRLRALQAFYKGILKGKELLLEDVQDKYKGKSYASPDVEDRRHLDDSIIHATVIRQDEPSEDQSSIYMIFERLNTGGTLLQPQEIRVALYRGRFVNLLRELNEDPAWRELYGRKSSTLKDHGLILQFLALMYWPAKYVRPMKEFLNRYMASNRDLPAEQEAAARYLFTRTTHAILQAIGPRAFRLKSAVNAAAADAVMVGVASRIRATGAPPIDEHLRRAYEALLRRAEFLDAVKKSTADEENVKRRLTLSISAFAGAA